MTQKEFNDVIKKYLEGECTTEEEKSMEEWYSSQKTEPLDMGTDEMASIEERMWGQIVQQSGIKNRFSFLKKLGVIAAAACALIVMGVSIKRQTNPVNEHLITEKKQMILPDGSEVILGKDGQLHYDENFNINHRNVTLTGSAFFNVKPDKTKPFLISSGELVTEVVGTSFEVTQNTELDIIEVKVVTGEVTVYNPKMKKQTKTILTPNQKVVYNKLFKNLNRTLVEAPQPLAGKESEESKFIFVNTSLKEVAKTFKEVYGIEFTIYDKKIEDCRVNADLENLPMFTKLDLICKSIEASYIINDTTVLLSGEGCD